MRRERARNSVCVGIPQPFEGPHHGSQGYCPSGHGHPDPSGAGPNGGRPPNADPLDSKNHCGGRTHSPTTGSHSASYSATLQGEPIYAYRMCLVRNNDINLAQLCVVFARCIRKFVLLSRVTLKLLYTIHESLMSTGSRSTLIYVSFSWFIHTSAVVHS